MPIRTRLLILPLAALTALAAVSLVALPGAGEAKLAIPKAPKVTQYPVTIDTAGYVDYKWTYDGRSKCLPGYSKTVGEEFSWELGRPRRAKLQIVGGTVVLFPVKAGQAVMRTDLSGFQTTNYCPPAQPVEIPEPQCKRRLSAKMGIGLGTELHEDEELAPLGRDTLAEIFPTKPFRQTASCLTERPRIETARENAGHAIEPPGLSIPTGIANTKLWNLKPGQTVTGTTRISGGCGRASASAHASSVPSTIKSCTLTGKAVVTLKRLR